MFIIIKVRKLPLFVISFIIAAILCTSIIFTVFKQFGNARNAARNQPEYIIIIEIDEKTLNLFEDDKCIKQYTIASGKPDWPSPIGSWKIITKGDWGEGFGGRWLGLDVRWGTYGIHGTTDESSIGKAASHGCIRMYNDDIKELYDIVSTGTPVIIKNGPFGPFGTGFRKLAPGDKGADVLAVQERLKALGYFQGYESGIYEDDLKSSIYQFQQDNKLQVKYTITREDYNMMGFKEFE
jgi:hypothetical protein